VRKENKRKKKEDRRNHRAKIRWPALFHRAAIKRRRRQKKPQSKNIVPCPIL